MFGKLVLIAIGIVMASTAAVKVEETAYQGWPNCYRVTNGEVELIVTSDIGPRVIRYGFVKGRNLFAEFAAEMGKSGEKEWKPRGGHRLWIAPESKGTYALDNGPVKIAIQPDGLVATQPVEPETGLEKQIIIKLAPTGSAVEVIHRLRNTRKTAKEFAPWALTMMAQSGLGIHGFPPRGKHPIDLLPSNPLTMWPYTNLSDKRWTFTKKYLMLQQDPKNADPQKLASFNPNTWAAYLLGTDLYIKRYTADPRMTYPDFGCSFETFTNAEFLELETVGPVQKVPAGGVAEHVERWTLHKRIKLAAKTDAELDRVLLPLLK
jgi:hypothetical protein